MSQPNLPEEPLNNADLESAMYGLRMALTPEESAEARRTFLQTLANSNLAVATTDPVAQNPDGSLAADANINMVVATNQEGRSGVPAFTTLGQLRGTLPGVENGIFLNGVQLMGMLVGSPHRLFIDGPDLHAEIDNAEMNEVLQAVQNFQMAQQQAMQQNDRLEQALAALTSHDTPEAREEIANAFVQGFARIPLAGDADSGADCIVLPTAAPGQPIPEGAPAELQLLTRDDALLCFTSEELMKAWDEATERQAVLLPGGHICQMSFQAQVLTIRVNPGHPDSRLLHLEPNRLVVE